VTGKGGRSVWEADARILIDDFEKTLGRDFATPDEEDDVDTLGGLVFTLAGRVPERGEIILDADSRRVKRLRIADGKRKSSGSVPKPREAASAEAKPPVSENNKKTSSKP